MSTHNHVLKLIVLLLMGINFYPIHYVFGHEIGFSALPDKDYGYHFESSKFGSLEFERNHEYLTALAIECIAKNNNYDGSLDKMPTSCISLAKKGINLTSFDNSNTNVRNEPIYNYRELASFVRWPDDPIRFLHTTKVPPAKFGVLIKKGCSGFFNDEGSDVLNVDMFEAGLFCVSHFGKLQFLHSMASKSGESAKQTRHLINQWSKYAFELSVSETLWNEEYCSFWSNFENTTDLIDLGEIMLEDSMVNGEPCSPTVRNYHYYLNWFKPEERRVDEYYQTWRLGITFNWHCKNMFGSKRCSAYVDQYKQAEKIRHIQMSALGSVIHMIQDSFAAGHTNRGNIDRKPKVILARVKSFRSYFGQDTDKHTESDKWPSFQETGTVTDPITAVAQLIWLRHQVITGKNTDLTVSEIIDNVYGPLEDDDTDALAGELYQASHF